MPGRTVALTVLVALAATWASPASAPSSDETLASMARGSMEIGRAEGSAAFPTAVPVAVHVPDEAPGHLAGLSHAAEAARGAAAPGHALADAAPEISPAVDGNLQTHLRVRDVEATFGEVRAARDTRSGLTYVLFQVADGNGRDDLVDAEARARSGERVDLVEAFAASDVPFAVDDLAFGKATRTWVATIRAADARGPVDVSVVDRAGRALAREFVLAAPP